MSLRAVDARFLLPYLPSTAVVIGGLEPWSAGLKAAGIEVVGSDDARRADVLVAQSRDVAAALPLGAKAIIAVGRHSAHRLRKAGWCVRRYLAVGGATFPEFLLPADQEEPLRYFVDRLRVAPDWLRWQRTRLAGRAIGRLANTAVPLPWNEIAVATPAPAVPAPCQAAARRLTCEVTGWIAQLGPPHAEGQVVFHIFTGGASKPSAMVKVRRVPQPAVFATADDDEQLPAIVARHRPRSLGAVSLGHGYHASLETAAAGFALTDFLRGPFSTHRKRRSVESVAQWTVDLAVATASQNNSRYRLSKDLSLARRFGLATNSDRYWNTLPRVFEHGDLWSRNVILDENDNFAVIDWVDENPAGLPFRDLTVFLADAFAEIDGVRTQAERDENFSHLFSGRGRWSPLLFAQMRKMADALSLPHEEVGPVVAVGIASLAQARTDEMRAAPSAVATTISPSAVEPAVRRAEIWLANPHLGAAWDAWPP